MNLYSIGKKFALAGLAAFIVAGFALSAHARPGVAAYNGNPAPDMRGIGADVFISSATAEQLVCTGRCLLLGLQRGTGPVGTHILIRNTSTIDGALTNRCIPFVHFQPDTGAHDNVLSFPVICNKGITVSMNSVSNGEVVGVLYIDLDP